MKVIVSKNSKIEGLLMKDWLQLKGYRRILITAILVFAILSIIETLNINEFSLFGIFPIIIIFCFEMFFITSFNYDEATKADMYIKSMPVSTKEVMSAKYIFAIISNIIGSLVGLILTIIMISFFGTSSDIDITDIMYATFMGIIGISALELIQIPFIYKFGAEKARMQMFLIMAIIIVILAVVIGGVIYWVEKLGIDTWILEGLSPLIIAILMVLAYDASFKISCRIYEKKEF